MKTKVALSFLGVAVIALFAFSPFLLTGAVSTEANAATSFSSPAAQQNYQSYGDLNKGMNFKSITSSLKQSDLKQKQIARSSYGCSTGCSNGCSTGCSTGCSVGCSVGCSSGCRD